MMIRLIEQAVQWMITLETLETIISFPYKNLFKKDRSVTYMLQNYGKLL